MGYLLKRKFFGAGLLRYFAAQDALIPCYDEFWVLFLSLSHSPFLCAGLSVLFGLLLCRAATGGYQRLDRHKFCRLDAVVVVHRVDTSGNIFLRIFRVGAASIVSLSAGVAHAAKTRLMRYRSVTENISGSISNTRRMSSNASTAIGAAASKNALFSSIFSRVAVWT